jgi:hypothetical protein
MVGGMIMLGVASIAIGLAVAPGEPADHGLGQYLCRHHGSNRADGGVGRGPQFGAHRPDLRPQLRSSAAFFMPACGRSNEGIGLESLQEVFA